MHIHVFKIKNEPLYAFETHFFFYSNKKENYYLSNMDCPLDFFRREGKLLFDKFLTMLCVPHSLPPLQA